MITKVKKLNPATTAVLVCDIQERFRDVIMGFESLVKCSGFVVKSAGELGMPVVVTEQYPKAFKKTVPEIASLLDPAGGNTTLDLLELGIDVHVCADAVSSQRDFDRTVALARLASSGAVVSTSESLVFQLLGNSRHPNFKAIAPFVKENADASKTSDLQHP
ncbi:isochorismatase domain-containing protein [Aureococcus anophagefferens]|nr:isochorismatase domain-containing protein [Aureococcus anophagefferens]